MSSNEKTENGCTTDGPQVSNGHITGSAVARSRKY